MNKSIIRTFFLTLGTIFAMILLIAGILGYLITGPPPIDDWGKEWIDPTDEAAERVDDKVATLEQEIDEAATGEGLILQLSDEEATSKLDQLARDGELSVEMERPQIYFSNGTVQALARVNTGIDIWVAIQATIGAKDGKPDVKIESLNLGRLPIPKTLVNSVVTALQRALEERWENLHVLLHEVIIGNGEITVTLIKK